MRRISLVLVLLPLTIITLTSCDMILGFLGHPVDNTFYVSENGNDDNNGTSEITSFLTLEKAVEAVLEHKDNNPEKVDFNINLDGALYGTTYIKAKDNVEITLQGNATIDAEGSNSAVLTLDGSYTKVLLDGDINLMNSTRHGVKIDNGASFTMKQGSISNNKTLNNNSFIIYGGGVNVSDGNFFMINGTITENDAEFGGGVYVNNNGTFVISGGTIMNNKAYPTAGNPTAGGVHCNGGDFQQKGGSITGNTNTQAGSEQNIYRKS